MPYNMFIGVSIIRLSKRAKSWNSVDDVKGDRREDHTLHDYIFGNIQNRQINPQRQKEDEWSRKAERKGKTASERGLSLQGDESLFQLDGSGGLGWCPHCEYSKCH